MRDEVTRYVDSDGNVSYYNKANQLHRLDGPAVEYADGTKYWYMEGKKHRLDGPALERANGYKEWYIDGKYYRTEKEWEKARCPSIEEAAAMFKEVRHE